MAHAVIRSAALSWRQKTFPTGKEDAASTERGSEHKPDITCQLGYKSCRFLPVVFRFVDVRTLRDHRAQIPAEPPITC